MGVAAIALLLCFSGNVNHAAEGLQEIRYTTAADGSEQLAMFFAPETDHAVPLLVVVHTWSGDYKQKYHADCLPWCKKKNWALIHPNFRGPNRRPEATGSDLVIDDIASAVAYAQQATRIDPSRIYLLGTSGGGYTALLMAGRRPELWAGVSAWVPISDLTAWYYQTKAAGEKQPLFRRTSGKVRITIFDGKHELISQAALAWLEKQRKNTSP